MWPPYSYDLACVPIASLDTLIKLRLYSPGGGLTAQCKVKREREGRQKRKAKKYIGPSWKRYVPPGWIEQPTFR